MKVSYCGNIVYPCKKGLPLVGQTKKSRVAWATWNPVWISEDHLVRLNTPRWPIANSTAKERWNRTSSEEWNRPWNHTLTTSGSLWWPRACWRMSQRSIRGGLVNLKGKPQWKHVWIKHSVPSYRPEPRWSTLDQDEALVIRSGGPNSPMLKNRLMSWG